MKTYMIQHNGTGQYSTGGLPPKFVRQDRAKIWRNESDLKRHLGLLLRHDKWPYVDCEVVILTCTLSSRVSVTTF